MSFRYDRISHTLCIPFCGEIHYDDLAKCNGLFFDSFDTVLRTMGQVRGWHWWPGEPETPHLKVMDDVLYKNIS